MGILENVVVSTLDLIIDGVPKKWNTLLSQSLVGGRIDKPCPLMENGDRLAPEANENQPRISQEG
jgi:hypothetical protein